jgi:hypothetical protein
MRDHKPYEKRRISVYDETNYAKAELHKPISYELVKLIVLRDGSEHTIRGWWTGSNWYSLRLHKGDKVVAWRMTSV